MKVLLALLLCPLPWPLRRPLLTWCFGYRFGPGARVGFSLLLARRVEMAAGSRIGHGTVVRGLSRLALGPGAFLGNFNWVTGFPEGPSRHFAHRPERRPELVLGREAAVTHRHLIDCTDAVRVGDLTTFAGFRSQILTHSIDLAAGRQDCAPVEIGARCFVGTACVLLAGARLPDRSVLAAGAVLARRLEEPGTLYGGVPARALRPVAADEGYFARERGFVV